MILNFMQLGKNIKTNEDNQKDNWDSIRKKLNEEYKELDEAIGESDLCHIAEEVQDLIQVCIRVLVLLVKKNMNLIELNRRHNKKLVNRGWEVIKAIGVLWNENE
ncbi:MazG nucleotide pyrophosphohydrolase domain-containing protein [Clostridium cagae]|uniref:MazG nucleotide pyrophosphohydrolase domain-containing protein n=1 Tax=Clostridium cagae TaxID=2080751 RepID=UPI003F76962D